MKKKSKKLLTSILIIMTVLVGIYFAIGGNKGATKIFNNLYNKFVNGEYLSEQASSDKFDQYFTDAFLGKLPVGAKIDVNQIIKTQIFTSGDQFCSSLEVNEFIPAGKIVTAIYNYSSRRNVQEKAVFPSGLNAGNAIGCEDLIYPIGKYEFKIYIDNVLVAVLPFKIE